MREKHELRAARFYLFIEAGADYRQYENEYSRENSYQISDGFDADEIVAVLYGNADKREPFTAEFEEIIFPCRHSRVAGIRVGIARLNIA